MAEISCAFCGEGMPRVSVFFGANTHGAGPWICEECIEERYLYMHSPRRAERDQDLAAAHAAWWEAEKRRLDDEGWQPGGSDAPRPG